MPVTDGAIAWPKKTREVIHNIMDSRPWNGFEFRDDDVVISTWAKSGTTWMQQIMAQLILGPDPELFGTNESPWIDNGMQPDAVDVLNAQAHRRFIKTHLPVDALVFSPKAKYLYIGRDVRDVIWSWHHHQSNFTPQAMEMLNALPDRTSAPLTPPNPDIRAYYHEFLATDGAPNWAFWSHIQGWWDIRHLPNVLLVHYADMKADLPAEVRRIAEFLDISVSEDNLAEMLSYCTVEHMRLTSKSAPMLSLIFNGGGESFINKGTNGRWRDVLSQDEIDKADRIAAEHLTPDCAHWLKTGELPA